MNAHAKYCSFSFLVLGLSMPLVFGQPVPCDAAGPVGSSSTLPWPWWQHTESSYIIYTDGTEFFSQDGETGRIFCRDVDARTVIQDSIDAVADGGRIFLKPGEYTISATRLILDDNLLIEGSQAAVLTSDPNAPTMIMNAQGKTNITIAGLTFRDCAAEAIRFKGGADIRILNCRFENIQKDAIVNFTDPLERVWIENCLIDAAGLAADSSGSPNYTGIRLKQTRDIFIRNNVVQFCGSTGIAGGAGRVIIENNISSFNDVNDVYGQGHGIIVGGGATDVLIRGNIVQENGGNGIEAGFGAASARYIITENIAVANGLYPTGPSGFNYRNGIYASSSDSSEFVLSNNVCVDGNGPGIKIGHAGEFKNIVVKGNICGNNGRGTLTTNPFYSSGLVLVGPDDPDPNAPPFDEKIQIVDNLILDDQDAPTQVRGIYCRGRVDGVLIEGNRVYGNGDGSGPQQIDYTANPNMIVRRNVGFATEGGGSFTISSGDVILVPHGLDIPPNRYYIHVTPHADLTGNGFWIAGADATNVEVRLSSPVVGPVEFGWSYVAP